MELGIAKLDKLLKLRENSNILLLGPPGNEKLVFALQFINKGLEEKQPCVYITTDVAPQELEERGKEYGFDVAQETGKQLSFIDCYSWTLGEEPKGRGKDVMVPGPSALNDLSIGITQAISEKYKPNAKSRTAIHSLSTLLLYNSPEVVYRFVQILGARLKASESTTLFLLESGMHDEKIVATIKHLADAVIELKGGEGKWSLAAPLNGIPTPIPFSVGKKGIELK